MQPERPPRDQLVRAVFPGVEYRAADDDSGLGTLVGHFAVFNQWTEINSIFEGHFMERIAPGAFGKTFVDQRDSMRVTFQHGKDPALGHKVLGPIAELREDETGGYYEVPLLDTDYNRDRVLPLLQGRTMDGRMLGSQVGASFRFRIVRDEWVRAPKPSELNPDGLPERTIREMRLYEFGPVVFPAYSGATAKVRCLTDHYEARRLARMGTAERAAKILVPAAGIATAPDDSTTPVAPPQTHPTVLPHILRARGFLAANGRTLPR
jgi:HK97 family phage prohead protease